MLDPCRSGREREGLRRSENQYRWGTLVWLHEVDSNACVLLANNAKASISVLMCLAGAAILSDKKDIHIMTATRLTAAYCFISFYW